MEALALPGRLDIVIHVYALDISFFLMGVSSPIMSPFPLWWGFSARDSWTLSIDPVKNTEEKKHFSGQEYQCDASRRPSGVNKYPCLKNVENICEQYVFGDNQKFSLSC